MTSRIVFAPISTKEKLLLLDELIVLYVQRSQLDEDAKEERRRVKDERDKIQARIDEIVGILRYGEEREEPDPYLPFVAQENVGAEREDEKKEDKELDVEVEEEDDDEEPDPDTEAGHRYPKRGELQ